MAQRNGTTKQKALAMVLGLWTGTLTSMYVGRVLERNGWAPDDVSTMQLIIGGGVSALIIAVLYWLIGRREGSRLDTRAKQRALAVVLAIVGGHLTAMYAGRVLARDQWAPDDALVVKVLIITGMPVLIAALLFRRIDRLRRKSG